MKRLSRFLSTLSTAIAGITLVRTTGDGMLGILIASLRLITGALTPLAAVLGALGTLLGLLSRDNAAVITGLAGTGLAVRHIRNATRPHSEFDRAFGPGWEARIPPQIKERMLAQRYAPLMPEDPPVDFQQDVEIAPGLLADLWQGPERSGLAVIYLHGSAWNYLDKDVSTRTFFRHLAAQGHIALDVAYRMPPAGTVRTMLDDVRRAVAWLKIHSAELNIDPDRIVLAGSSAGGHLALLAAYTAHVPELQTPDIGVDAGVCSVISYYGIPDLREYQAISNNRPGTALMDDTHLNSAFLRLAERIWDARGWLPEGATMQPMQNMLPSAMGATLAEDPELYALLSPINHVGPHCPPTLLLQAAHDVAGSVPAGRRLYHMLREAGVPVVHVELADTEHGFDLAFPRISPAAQAALYNVDRFLGVLAAR